jgi:hypothetical protein
MVKYEIPPHLSESHLGITFFSNYIKGVQKSIGMISGEELFEILCEERNQYILQTQTKYKTSPEMLVESGETKLCHWPTSA